MLSLGQLYQCLFYNFIIIVVGEGRRRGIYNTFKQERINKKKIKKKKRKKKDKGTLYSTTEIS